MKHAIAITSMLLLAMALSCREAPRTEETAEDAGAAVDKNLAERSTTNPTSRRRDQDWGQADPNEAAKRAFRTARELYKNQRDYKAAGKGFLSVVQRFAKTQYASPSQVYLHLCRAQVSIAKADWSLAGTELVNASEMRRKIRKNSTLRSPVYRWATSMEPHIRQLQIMLMERQAFARVMTNAKRLYDQKEYDQAGAMLRAAYEDPSSLPDDLQRELKAFKAKLAAAGWSGSKSTDTIRKGILNKKALDALDLKASTLYDKGQWAKALPLLKKLRIQNRGVRKYREMLRTCEFELELVEFKKAVGANAPKRAMSSAGKLRDIQLDRYESEIEPELALMRAKAKVAEILAKGAKELENGQYRQARKTVDHLKDSYPEAAEIIRRSRYLEALKKADDARKEGDDERALPMYKIAKNYSKTPAERKKIDTLIDTLSE